MKKKVWAVSFLVCASISELDSDETIDTALTAVASVHDTEADAVATAQQYVCDEYDNLMSGEHDPGDDIKTEHRDDGTLLVRAQEDCEDWAIAALVRPLVMNERAA